VIGDYIDSSETLRYIQEISRFDMIALVKYAQNLMGKDIAIGEVKVADAGGEGIVLIQSSDDVYRSMLYDDADG